MTDMRQIERDLDHSQQALTDTLGQLRDRLAPEALTRDGLAVLQSQGTAFLGAVDRAIDAATTQKRRIGRIHDGIHG